MKTLTEIDQSSHYKGLSVLFVSSLFERFAYYVLLIIMVISLQHRFGLPEDISGVIYSVFIFLPVVFSFIAGPVGDRFNYGKAALIGIAGITLAYAFLAFSGQSFMISIIGFALLSLSIPFFKLNNTVLCANLYEPKGFRKFGVGGFIVFYLATNIGFFFSLYAVDLCRDLAFNMADLEYSSELAGMAFSYLNGTIQDVNVYAEMVACTTGSTTIDLQSFSQTYTEAINLGYTFSFRIAFLATAVSLVVFSLLRKNYKYALRIKQSEKSKSIPKGKRIGHIFLIMLAALFIYIVIGSFVVIQDYSQLANINHDTLKRVFNPMFIILLTPVVLIGFSFLDKKFPAFNIVFKIIVGIIILIALYVVQLFGSFGTTTGAELFMNPGNAISSAWFITIIGVITLAEILIGPLISLLAIRSFPEKRRGLWFAIFGLGSKIGSILVAFIVSIFYTASVTGYYALCLVFLAIGIVLFMVVRKRHKKLYSE